MKNNIKTVCGIEKYDELSKRKGFLNQLRFYWFVLSASLWDIGKKKNDIRKNNFGFPSYFILHVETPPQPTPSSLVIDSY